MNNKERINIVLEALEESKRDASELLKAGRLFDFKKRCDDIDALERCLMIEIETLLDKVG